MNNKIYFEGLEDPITEKDILKFEKKFKVKLPEDYKEFLLKYNGGIIHADLFINKKRKRFNPLKIKQSTECGIGLMYDLEMVGLRKKENDSLEELPKSIFQIGYTGSDNFLCISMSDKDFGCIYYATNGDPHDNYEYMYHLADNFTEFLNGLVPFDE